MDLSSLQSRASSSSSAGAYFPPHRTQLHPRLYYAPPPPAPRTPLCGGGDRRWILSAGLLILPFLFYLFAAAGRAHLSSHFDAPRPKGFGLVIDAGSSGSRIHVFEFLNEGRIPFVGFDGKGSVSMRVKPGLVAFAAAPEEAGGSILKLLEFAKGRVPTAEWRTTKVQLIENGGLGSCPLRVRTAILESCRQVLRSSGFMFRDDWVSTITGQQKGIYAWIAANYVLGTLGGNHQETMGIIELGGASAQITFVPEEPPPLEYSRMLKLPGVTYNLYCKSIHQAGQDLAWESLTELRNSSIVATASGSIEGPIRSSCIPKGYNRSSIATSNALQKNISHDVEGNFATCRSKAYMFLQQGEILQRFKADMQGQQLAFEKFFYISELFGMTPKASLSDVEAAGRHYCEDHWVSLKEEHFGIDEMDLKKYCFSSAFMVSLLHDGLGIPMEEKRIGFAVPTGSSPLDWTLGAFILQTVVETESGAETITNIAGSDTLTFISLFAILLLVTLSVLYVWNWRRPRLKTIYDLEKGHYIVTRMPV
ncbi:probable apyrase 6 [Musa acuminata AAA Group]|uniref:probable apyrase 6 n=1 Tax=Musa acuminata AAA Group TaxID=214697 RepID=UPI0031CE348F